MMTLLLRPIPALREGLERIGRGDLDSPMEIKDPTELGALARSINHMAGQLKASQSEIHLREQEIVATQKEIIHTLGDVVESRSSETANHTLRVAAMSMKLGELMGLSADDANLVRMASPMHDVGKIGIPDSILNKPGKLTAEEFEIMKTHSEIGYSILAKSERLILQAAAIIAHEHHERWDGSGYPAGLAGEDIHIFGRIVSLVDVFDAVYSDRVYRPAMELDRVLEIIRDGRGSHFQPELVDLFLGNLDTFLAIHGQFDDMDRYLEVLTPMDIEEPEPELVTS
jgi:response regulator RpfG family c-di-GMP phosphodiesterase